MAELPRQFYPLDDVKNIPILDVCNHLGIHVERRGRNYWCKVRPERTASVILHPEQNTFYDFGSQKSGSNIDLVCYATGKSFTDAVKDLGDSFGLQPESKADSRRRFRTMTRADYSRIGLHSDIATKNFTFPIAKYSPDKLLEIEARYHMPMNTLRKKHPKTYERILREKAIPYVEQVRNLYYLDVWNYFCLMRSIKQLGHFYDSERTIAKFEPQTKHLEQVERSLYKAAFGTSLHIPPPAHYDPLRVISRILTDRLSISLGNCTPEEMTDASFIGNDATSSLSLNHDAFFGAELDDIPHAAILTKDDVKVICFQNDLPEVELRVGLEPAGSSVTSIDKKIQEAEGRRKFEQKSMPQREMSFHR